MDSIVVEALERRGGEGPLKPPVDGRRMVIGESSQSWRDAQFEHWKFKVYRKICGTTKDDRLSLEIGGRASKSRGLKRA